MMGKGQGKNAIELASEADVADTLRKVREAVELGELDKVIEQQARFGRRVAYKTKWGIEGGGVHGLSTLLALHCVSACTVNYGKAVVT